MTQTKMRTPRPSEIAPCAVCGSPERTKNSNKCRPCYNEYKRMTHHEKKNDCSWERRNQNMEKARKAKSLDFLSASGRPVNESTCIVECFYHRIAKKNVLAWKISEARLWATQNNLDKSEIVKSVCPIRLVDVNLTGCELPGRRQ
jgi:hypothetical protein